jgi:hypothetical protein
VSADEIVDFGASLGRWYAVVRRARLADYKKKAVALTVGSYANTDGTSVKCGVARLAADCEMGFSTARRYLAWMREVGLIELVKVGNRKAKRADEYRLTVLPHTEKAINALDEAEYHDLVDGMKATNRTGEKARRLSALAQEVSAEATDSEGADEEPSALTQRTERRSGFLRSPMSEPPPKDKRSPLTGGAPPPGPRRRPPPPASATDENKSPSDPLTPAQDQQRNSLPHARPPNPAEHVAPVVDFFTREAM